MVHTIVFPPSGSMLDVACGPGNLLLKIHKKHPALQLTGLDIDPAILHIASKKTRGLSNIKLVESSATKLPFKDNQFAIVTSSLAFHHLDSEQKQEAFKEIFRVLKPGGNFWLFDFAKPETILGKFLAKIYRHIEETDDGIKNRLPSMYKNAGFQNIKTYWSSYGMISLLSGQKPVNY